MISGTIRILCHKLGISIAELARRTGTSPQAFNQRLQRESFTTEDLNSIAKAVGCKYESVFILPNGERVEEQFFNSYSEEGKNYMKKKRYLSDADIERRCRYRLEKHGMRMHKINSFDEPLYHLYYIGEDKRIPDDEASFFTLSKLLDYCERLAENEEKRR